MRRLLLVRATYAIATLTTLASSGCATKIDRDVDTTQTTSAAASTKSVEMPSSSNGGENISINETPRPDIESTESPHLHFPLHEPNGSTYGDVGMPYPLPSVPVQLPRATPTAPSSETPPFFETSFGPSPAPVPFLETSFGPAATSSGGFPETSFGPTPAANGGFPESSFGPDAGP